MKVSELNQIIENIVADEVRKTIMEESTGKKEVYHIKCEGIPLATFESEDDAKEELPKYKSKHKGELIIEKGVYESQDDMLDKLDEINDQLEEEDNMKNTQEPMEGNAFSAALIKARENGDKTFTVDGEEHDVEECWNQMEEEEMKEEEENCMECGGSYMEEELVGGQKKLDKNHNGKIDAQDFKILKGQKKDVKEGTCEKCGKEICECGSGMYENNDGLGDVEDVTSLKDLIHWKKNCGDNCKIYRKGSMTVTLENYDELLAYHFDVVSGDMGDKNPDLEFTYSEEIEEFDPEMFNESINKKKTLRLTESELTNLIAKMVNESVPGLEAAKKSHTESGKENNSHLSDVDKKMKDYLSIPGNNNNKFPEQNKKGDNVKVNPTSEEDETIADERGRGLENLEYDHEPSSQFKERLKKAIEGHATMGNSQDYANVVKTDLPKKLEKEVKRKSEEKKEEPRYKKEAQPTKALSESQVRKSNILEEEINKMKKLSNYNKKTQ